VALPSGQVTPRDVLAAGGDRPPRRGRRALEVAAVALSTPGLQLTSPEPVGPDGLWLAPHASRRLEVTFRIEDCRAATTAAPAPRIRVSLRTPAHPDPREVTLTPVMSDGPWLGGVHCTLPVPAAAAEDLAPVLTSLDPAHPVTRTTTIILPPHRDAPVAIMGVCIGPRTGSVALHATSGDGGGFTFPLRCAPADSAAGGGSALVPGGTLRVVAIPRGPVSCYVRVYRIPGS
jgi:hypothetical protein